jgi:hypothetical protein
MTNVTFFTCVFHSSLSHNWGKIPNNRHAHNDVFYDDLTHRMGVEDFEIEASGNTGSPGFDTHHSDHRRILGLYRSRDGERGAARDPGR